MDATYLKSTLGDVVAKGCAATITAAPVDPIEYLSLWLLKHVENQHISMQFIEEKDRSLQAQHMKQEEQQRTITCENKEKKICDEAINQLYLIKGDPYLLYDACLKAIAMFTGCTSAYIALVLDKLWDPLPRRETTGYGEEDDEHEVETEEEHKEEDDDKRESDEQLSEDKEEQDSGGGHHDQQQEDMENVETQPKGLNKKRGKHTKPHNYEKKILIYVAATLDNSFMINRQLDKKLGPVTYRIMLEGATQLHVPNVLHEEGIYYFQGLPRMGAYFAVPVLLNTDAIKITAILCADTLKKEGHGTGRPFSVTEQRFILAVSQAMSDVLTDNLRRASTVNDTEKIMKVLQSQCQQIKDAYNKRKSDAKDNDTESTTSQLDNKESDAEQDEGDKDEDAEDEEIKENDSEGEEIPKEEEEGKEQEQDSVKYKLKKDMKKQKKSIEKIQTMIKQSQVALEKWGFNVSKLQKQLSWSGEALQHAQALLSAVVDAITEVKDQEFLCIKSWPFPPLIIYQVIKAILSVIGHSKEVIDDWTKARLVLNDDFCTALRSYNPLHRQEFRYWELSDAYIEGITEKDLSKESPIGYLGQQWLIAAKTVTNESLRHQKCKVKYQHAAKTFADMELEKMIAEIDLKVAIDEESRLVHALEEGNVAKEPPEGKMVTGDVDHLNDNTIETDQEEQ